MIYRVLLAMIQLDYQNEVGITLILVGFDGSVFLTHGVRALVHYKVLLTITRSYYEQTSL